MDILFFSKSTTDSVYHHPRINLVFSDCSTVLENEIISSFVDILRRSQLVDTTINILYSTN